MSVVQMVLRRVPTPLRPHLVKHREMVKFALVGGTCFVITIVVDYALKFTVLNNKPVTALTIATIVATIASYLLNRGWSFRTRGGRRRHHEMVLFFLISAIGIVLNDVPLYIARYAFQLQTPNVSSFTQEVSDFVAGLILGTMLAMVFRWWAMKKWVFPHANVRGAAAAPRDVLVVDRETVG